MRHARQDPNDFDEMSVSVVCGRLGGWGLFGLLERIAKSPCTILRHLQKQKFEMRNPKSETNQNDRNPNDTNRGLFEAWYPGGKCRQLF